MKTLSTILFSTIVACTNALQAFDASANYTVAADDMDGLQRYTQPLAEAFVDVEIKL